MTENFLQKILCVKRERVEASKRIVSQEQLREEADEVRTATESFRLQAALQDAERINVIAEIKRASPSKGVINGNIDVAETARAYANGGACAISVLTEEDFFKGTLDDLRMVRGAADIPLLRKDFVFDEYQIYEAVAAGADAVLLIVAALSHESLERLYAAAHDLGLDALVEVHDFDEFETAKAIGANLIGVNNRNLNTFEVSLDVSRDLIRHKPVGSLMVSESGLGSDNEILELKSLGFDGFLIGETLMRTDAPGTLLEKLTAVWRQ